MPKCVRIKPKHRQYCIGDLRDEITLFNRSIQAPDQGGVDFEEDFEVNVIVLAAVETVDGETIFDESNQERVVTHKIGIRFLPGITQETWVDIKTKRLDILTVENFEERDEWLVLKCTNRGTNTAQTNFA